MRGRRRIAPILLALTLCTLTAACGARLTDDQLATATASGGVGPSGQPTGGNGAATGGTGGSATPGAAGGTGAVAGTPGATTPGGGAVAGGGCTPEPGSTSPGVSDDEIVIGNVSTISGPIAGFGQTGVNAVKAFANYINSLGGVCGRQVRVATGDDRLDPGANRSETERLGDEVFAFVGDTTVVDDGGTGIIERDGIPDVSLAIGSLRAASSMNFSPNPLDPNQPGNASTPIMSYFASQYGVTSAAVVYPTQSDAAARAHGYTYDLNQAGIANVSEFPVAITETNYTQVAQRIKDAGIQLVVTTLEVNGMSRLAQAFKQLEYQPTVPFYGAQAYGGQFLNQAGDAADGTILGITFSIFEDADSNPAMATFLEWYHRTNPGSEPDFFAINAWAAADMWARAMVQAGGAPTREGFLTAMRATTEYTGDGFMAPRNPAAKTMGNCFLVVTVTGGVWTRVDPASGFRC